ncbi:hypothetical protein [Hoylesella nanceiensis]
MHHLISNSIHGMESLLIDGVLSERLVKSVLIGHVFADLDVPVLLM